MIRVPKITAIDNFFLALSRLLAMRDAASHFVPVILSIVADMDSVGDSNASGTVVAFVRLVASSITIVISVSTREIVSRRGKYLGPVPRKDGFEGRCTSGQECHVYNHARGRKANPPGLIMVVWAETPRVYDNANDTHDNDAVTRIKSITLINKKTKGRGMQIGIIHSTGTDNAKNCYLLSPWHTQMPQHQGRNNQNPYISKDADAGCG